jgi:hypothetical protein
VRDTVCENYELSDPPLTAPIFSHSRNNFRPPAAAQVENEKSEVGLAFISFISGHFDCFPGSIMSRSFQFCGFMRAIFVCSLSIFCCLLIGRGGGVDGTVLRPIPLECAGSRQTCSEVTGIATEERNVENLNSFSSSALPAAFHVDALASNISNIVSGDVILIPYDVTLPNVWQLPDMDDSNTNVAPLFVIKNEENTGGLLSDMPSQFLNPTLVEALNLSTIVGSGHRYFHSADFRDIASVIQVVNNEMLPCEFGASLF